MSDGFRILGIAGSVRARSYNRALLRAAAEEAPAGVEVAIHDLREIPLYDADVDAAGPPEAVLALKQAIAEADALLIASPEYNASIPGVLKNALDWASRPPAASPLRGKHAALMGTSPGRFGSLRAQLVVRQVLFSTGSPVLMRPELIIPHAARAFDDEPRLVDDTAREILRTLLSDLVTWVRR
jgi:chromate reductase